MVQLSLEEREMGAKVSRFILSGPIANFHDR